jgi:alpha-galactosidase
MKTVFTIGCIGIWLILAGTPCPAGSPVSWELGAGFSDTNNPSGVWSYGWGTGLYDFDLYDLVGPFAAESGPMWLEKESDKATGPILWRNSTDTILYGVGAGKLAQHPGPDRHCKIRWSSPGDIKEPYLLAVGQWGSGAGGAKHFWVVKNSSEIIFNASNETGDVPFELLLRAGDLVTLDFCQGAGEIWSNENAPLELTVTPVSQLSFEPDVEYLPYDLNQDRKIDQADMSLIENQMKFYRQISGSGYDRLEDVYAAVEKARKDTWVKANFSNGEPSSLFTFVYDGIDSRDWLKKCKLKKSSAQKDGKNFYTHIWTDKKSGLQVRCEAVEYMDFPTVEWTLYFKNTGKNETPILHEIQTMDANFTHLAGQGDYHLHYNKGDFCTADSFMPYDVILERGAAKTFAPVGGRSTNLAFPYYNIHCGGEGLIYVLSWNGQWKTALEQNADGTLHLAGAQELTHFKLLPGEEVRAPMALVQFYAGDWIRGQNRWRQWMVSHNLPRRQGKLIEPYCSLCTGNHFPNLRTNAKDEITALGRAIEQGIELDYWWQDAGWYEIGDRWDWKSCPDTFPNGIKEVGDFARAHGIGTLVWFEPEHVYPNYVLLLDHPEWTSTGKPYCLFRLDIPECRQRLTDIISEQIATQNIDFYRQDFNLDPLPSWRRNDTEDRQGISEAKHVAALFQMWDELVARHPKLWIDSCASGGRRNDLETMRRAVPMLRSDKTFVPDEQQCHTYGLAMWFPYYGTGFIDIDLYLMRSVYCPEFTIGSDLRRTDLDYELLRKGFKEWQVIKPYFYGDFYPMTDYSLADDVWMGWQFNDPAQKGGFVQAFRRAKCSTESAIFQLRGLDINTIYEVRNLDTDATILKSGYSLMKEGLGVKLDQTPGSAVILYKTIDGLF